MVRVEIAGITYDIGNENGIYFARASSGDSPVGMTIEQLSQGLAQVTGLKQQDLYEYLIGLGI